MKRRTHQQFIEEIKRIHTKLEIMGEYISVTEKILVKCTAHNYTFYATPDNLLHGKGCKLCGREKMANSKKLCFNEIEDEFKRNNIILLSTEDEIMDLSKDRLRYLCPKHGEQTILWNNFKRGARCRKCADEKNSLRMRKETWERIKGYFKNSEYTLLSTFEEYTGARENCIRCLCKKHGEFKISWNNLQKFEGCAVCNSSAGERRIYQYLQGNNIEFEKPKTFTNLIGVGGKKLSYDFYLPEFNLLIEYQGEQHERPVAFNDIDEKSTIKNFQKQQEHDRKKRDYSSAYGIGLIEIWYYDFDNIENILTEKIYNTK